MPDTNYHYPDYAIIEKITDTFRKAGAHAVHATAGKVVTIKTLLKQWAAEVSPVKTDGASVSYEAYNKETYDVEEMIQVRSS